MIKDKKIKALHKILYIRENSDNGLCKVDDFYSYLTECIVMFSGLDDKDKTDKKVIQFLKGIKELGEELTTKELRCVILRLMNDYEREG